MKEKILLFIPGYNCEKQIYRVLNSLISDVLEYIEEVIVVNNRSKDNTELVVSQFIVEHPEIKLNLLRNDENYGLGGSHKVAFSYAIKNGFDFVIVLHGDDQGDINDMLQVLRNGDHREYDCCLGARFQKGSRLKGYSSFRTFGNRVYNFLFSLVVAKQIYDLGSGLNIYNVNMLKHEFYKKFPDNLIFNYCMILASNFYKQKIMFFPITWKEDDQISNVKLFSQATRVLGFLANYFLQRGKFITSELRDQPRECYTAQIINGKNVTYDK
ncbi:glycosyltransferase family 2 protein [Paenibacillus sp. GP183]|uniref:glycosyltransferase family 2 protein n=1 Tax=Paenibacillus sp. GP183 TaxID=1882751 RepID=UPI000894DF91|nr:glycosyltransferase family 2 protein [Paenibacillus sp. GP183]SEC12634.1 Glycosyl transferase family 2 [Paenibacillus sp. GP183]